MIYLQPYCICWLPSGAETEQDEAEESEATEGSEEEAAAEAAAAGIGALELGWLGEECWASITHTRSYLSHPGSPLAAGGYPGQFPARELPLPLLLVVLLCNTQ